MQEPGGLCELQITALVKELWRDTIKGTQTGTSKGESYAFKYRAAHVTSQLAENYHYCKSVVISRCYFSLY